MPRSDAQRVVNVCCTLWLLLIAVAAVANSCNGKAHAQDSTVETAARICYLEAQWRKTDCAAILWSASKRSGAPLGSASWKRALASYSANAMRRSIDKRLRLGAAFVSSARWQAHLQFVARVLSGDVADPCPHAYHFGGSMDHARGRMVPARCSERTANTFYALARRR